MNYQALERAIGHQFADIALLDLAMTHPSYALAHKCKDNQRLEFLGDAVLGLLFAGLGVGSLIYRSHKEVKRTKIEDL